MRFALLSLSVFGFFAPILPTSAAPMNRHATNYDEDKVGAYSLPDPLVLQSGDLVQTAEDWTNRRRPELLQLYENEVFGRVPATAPGFTVEVLSPGDVLVANGQARLRHVILHFGEKRRAHVDLVIYVPAHVRGHVPVLLQMVFHRGLGSEQPAAEVSAEAAKRVGFPEKFTETGPVADILKRGYAYATFKYTDIQPDERGTESRGVESLAYAEGQTAPRPDQWGAISAWAWAASRVLDYIAANPVLVSPTDLVLDNRTILDAKRVALIGHSRLGKAVLWAGARDPRFALVFASCSGEMGAALSRRDYGETIDDIATSFPWWFCRNFQKYVGHWNDLPVDAHCLLALNAPRPLFLTGGSEDQWADPRGEFLAAVAAEPVYALFGQAGIGSKDFPPMDEPTTFGQIGWLYHRGPHAITDLDWQTFLKFADKKLK